MPVKWSPDMDQLLLLKILETHDITVDSKRISEAWPSDKGDAPTPRAIQERLVKIRQLARKNGSASTFNIASSQSKASSSSSSHGAGSGSGSASKPRGSLGVSTSSGPSTPSSRAVGGKAGRAGHCTEQTTPSRAGGTGMTSSNSATPSRSSPLKRTLSGEIKVESIENDDLPTPRQVPTFGSASRASGSAYAGQLPINAATSSSGHARSAMSPTAARTQNANFAHSSTAKSFASSSLNGNMGNTMPHRASQQNGTVTSRPTQGTSKPTPSPGSARIPVKSEASSQGSLFGGTGARTNSHVANSGANSARRVIDLASSSVTPGLEDDFDV